MILIVVAFAFFLFFIFCNIIAGPTKHCFCTIYTINGTNIWPVMFQTLSPWESPVGSYNHLTRRLSLTYAYIISLPFETPISHRASNETFHYHVSPVYIPSVLIWDILHQCGSLLRLLYPIIDTIDTHLL